MKLELLTKATVVYDAIRFVSERTKKDRLISEEEESQTTAATAAAAAATAATTHQVFKWSRDVHTQTYQNTCKITMAGRWFIPNPERDKVHWAIRCDYCYQVIVHWKDNREDLDTSEIMRYGEQEIEDERARVRVFSPNGRLPLFPDVYRLRNSNRDLCKDCHEVATIQQRSN